MLSKKNIRKNMKPLYIVSALAYICCVGSQSTCRTSSGGRGECKDIKQCSSLLALALKPNRSPEETYSLQRSRCDNQQNGQVLLCCPAPLAECYTPDGDPGSCISVYSCPNLVNLLLQKTPAAYDYVQRSRCQGQDQFSVCCGSGNGPKPTTLQTANPNPPNSQNNKCVSNSNTLPDPSSGCCGVESEGGDRIFGGNDTALDQYPWLTVLEYTTDSNEVTLQCGGALISGKYVLTAAHCLVGSVLRYGTPTNVRLGEYNTANEGPDCASTPGGGRDCTRGTVRIPIERTIPHPEYNPNNAYKWNDIAILRLTQTAPYTEFIRPICLPTTDLTLNTDLRGKFTFWVAGWGATSKTQTSSDIKQHVAVPFVPLKTCEPNYRLSSKRLALIEGQLCAGGEKGKDSCTGDSGGPLMYQINKVWEATGVVSYGPKTCGAENIPAVYTNVFQYIPWIRSQIRS